MSLSTCGHIIEQHIRFLTEEFDCEQRGENEYAITTPFQYPDFDLIQIYVRVTADGRMHICDRGEALRHVASLCGHDIFHSQRSEIREIANSHALQIGGDGMLSTFTSFDEVGEATFRLSQAMKDIASLYYTVRAHKATTFEDEVRTFLTSQGLRFDSTRKLKGSVLEHNPDLCIQRTGTEGVNIAQVVGGSNRSEKAKDAYIMFDDLLRAGAPVGRKVLVDKVLAPNYMALLRSKSDDVIFWKEDRREIVERLRA